jgi:predicted aspartyl protease
MSDWRIASIIGLLAALVLAISNLRGFQYTSGFVIRSIAIWAVIILVITTITVYRFEIADFFAPMRAMMP